jgi:hypothetical protein
MKLTMAIVPNPAKNMVARFMPVTPGVNQRKPSFRCFAVDSVIIFLLEINRPIKVPALKLVYK